MYRRGRGFSGGASVNSVPFESWMEVDMRSESPASLARIEQAFLVAVDRGAAEENELRRGGDPLQAIKEKIGNRPSGELDPSTPVIQRTLAATTQFSVADKLVLSSTASNIRIALGIPAVTIGRGGQGAQGQAPD